MGRNGHAISSCTIVLPERNKRFLKERGTLSKTVEMKEEPNHPHEPWKAFQVRQRSLDTKRDAVLQTAAHLFLEHSYQRTSMSELGASSK